MTKPKRKKSVAELDRDEARAELARLAATILRHDRAYHLQDAPKVSDAAYDKLRKRNEEIEVRFPDLLRNDSPSLRVGALPAKGFRKVRHRSPMLSLDNAFGENEVAVFLERVRRFLGFSKDEPLDVFAEPKIDGLSASLTYENGKLAVGATRGDGKEGEDVKLNLQTIETIPESLPPAAPSFLEVRGEVYLSIDAFERVNGELHAQGKKIFANPRNVAAGSIRQMDPAVTAKRELGFFVHSWGESSEPLGITVGEVRKKLAEFGFKPTPRSRQCSTFEEMCAYQEELYTERPHLGFDVDGIVFKVDRLDLQDRLGAATRAPRHSLASKFPAEKAKTELRSIEIQVGRTGALTPVANLKPVTVGGVVVQRATLHNKDEVQRLDVRKGDTITVQRAGDVIPQIVEVDLERRPQGAKPFDFPDKCPSCGRKAEQGEGEVITRCPGGRDCEAQKFAQLVHFVGRGAFDIDGVAENQLREFWDLHGLRDPSDLFALAADEKKTAAFAERRGWGELSIRNFKEAVEARRKIPFGNFLYSLGIRHVGQANAIQIARATGSVQRLLELADGARNKDGLMDEESEAFVELLSIDGVGKAQAYSLIEFFTDPASRKMIKNLLERIMVEDAAPPAITDSQLSGKTFVFTGTLETITRNEAKSRVEALGGRVSSALSTRTDYLVTGEGGGGKRKKAEDLKVETLDEKAFRALIKG